MSFAREEVREAQLARSTERVASRIPQLMSIAAVAPRMDALTHDDKWDSYLGFLMGVREKIEASRDAARERMGNPNLVNHDELMRQKLTMLINEAQIQAIDLAIGLPKALFDSAGEAQKLIEKFEEGRKREAA
jgi:hypothetical protein